MSNEKKLNNSIFELIKEVEKEIEEATTGGSIAGYQTPNAFGNDSEKSKKKTKDVSTQAGYTVVNESQQKIKAGDIYKTPSGDIIVFDSGEDESAYANYTGFNPTTKKTYKEEQPFSKLIPKISKWKRLHENINEATTKKAPKFSELPRNQQLAKMLDHLNSLSIDGAKNSVEKVVKLSKAKHGWNVTYKSKPGFVDDRDSQYATDFIYPHELGESVVTESKILPQIQSLIDDMVKRKIQRKTVTVGKNSDGHQRFMKDVKPAIDAKLLSIKHNPINDNEMWISLGPNAQSKIGESIVNESPNEGKLIPKKLTDLKVGEPFFFNDNHYEFIELRPGKDTAKVKDEKGNTSNISFGGGIVNKKFKSGMGDYLGQGGRVWDHKIPTKLNVNEGQFILSLTPHGSELSYSQLKNQKIGTRIYNKYRQGRRYSISAINGTDIILKDVITGKETIVPSGMKRNESINESEFKGNVIEDVIDKIVKKLSYYKVVRSNDNSNDIILMVGNRKHIPVIINVLKKIYNIKSDVYRPDFPNYIKIQKGQLLENLNEYNSREEHDANEFYGDTSSGKLLDTKFNGKFDANKFKKLLNNIIVNVSSKTSSTRVESVIKLWCKLLGLNAQKYVGGDIIEDVEFINDATKQAEKYYKIFKNTNESLSENRWLDLKNDESMHPHKKLSVGLKELRNQLSEVEKFLGWYNKLKNINELDTDNYWKRTNSNIYKIKERIINIAKTLKEIEN